MEHVGDGARLIHVVFGFLGLAAFWVPVFSKKGAARHVLFGKLFLWSAYIILAAAAIALTTRVSGNIADGVGLNENAAYYGFMVFLGYLILTTFVTVRHGVAVLKSKGKPQVMRTRLNRALALAAIAASAVLVIYAVVIAPPNKILLFALSPIGVGTGYGILRYIRGSDPSKRAWMYEHMGSMLGGGIAFHTAFAVFGSNQLFEIGLEGWVAVIPWIAPAAIGIPAIVIWTRHYRRRFDGLATAA